MHWIVPDVIGWICLAGDDGSIVECAVRQGEAFMCLAEEDEGHLNFSDLGLLSDP